MALDTDKIDDAVLALLFLTLRDHWRAWKGFDWDALNRLYERGFQSGIAGLSSWLMRIMKEVGHGTSVQALWGRGAR